MIAFISSLDRSGEFGQRPEGDPLPLQIGQHRHHTQAIDFMDLAFCLKKSIPQLPPIAIYVELEFLFPV